MILDEFNNVNLDEFYKITPESDKDSEPQPITIVLDDGTFVGYENQGDIKGQFTFNNGDQYYGQFNSSYQLQGDGKMVYQNQAKYVGSWFNGVRHGNGAYWDAEGTYEGTWSKGSKFCGKMNYVDGSVYTGEWMDESRHGRGSYLLANGTKIDSTFVHGDATGRGVISYCGGDVYEGEICCGERHGRGTMRYHNSEAYTGDWVGNKKHGCGVMAYSDGSRYDGGFADDKRSGEGNFRLKAGEYTGGFLNDLKHGTGTWAGSNRELYAGQWRCGLRNGYGKARLPNGDEYEGPWADNVIQTTKQTEGAMLQLSTGAVYVGGFRAGKFHGRGVLTLANGDVFEGDFERGEQRTGVWTLGAAVGDE